MTFSIWLLVIANAAGWGTLLAGWVAVPVVALVGGLLAPARARPLVSVPLGGVLGWAALLALDARAPGFRALVEVMGRLLPFKVWQVAAATLGLALVLALGAALIGTALRRAEEAPSKGEVGS